VSAAVSDSAPSLAVVVLNWNGRDLLDDCLESLRDSYPDLRVVVVDNDSTDDSVEVIRERYDWTELVRSPENRRWAGGNNLGLAHLRESGLPDFVLLLNNDTIVGEGCLATLVATLMAAPDAWAVTPRICYADAPETIWYDGGRVGAWTGWVSHRGIRRSAAARPARITTTDYGTGCALMLRREALEEVGDLDESYHLYAEDTDYSLRIRGLGRRILHCPEAKVLHKVSMSVGADSPGKAYLKSRSHVRLLRRHWRPSRWPLLWPSQLVLALATAAWHLAHGRPGTARAGLLGLADEIVRRPLRIPSAAGTRS
jgi:GT2 family glycosyltransferase